ncbi:MAG: hypothetical protein ABR569_00430 [Gaiellaceae bacterium]
MFFYWTATLRGGTLTLEGAINLRARATVYPIEAAPADMLARGGQSP